MPRWLTPALLVLLCAASSVLAVRAPAGGGAGTPDERVAVAVLSPRRAPVFLVRAVADARLRTQLDARLADPAVGAGRDRSCLVVRQGARTVVERRPDESLIPASNLKVLTGLAVLERLGPDERLVTEVRATAPVAGGGTVDGPLYLVGGGDPLLGTADYAESFENQPQLRTSLEVLADQVVAAGVRTVTGGLVGDESRYDTQRYIPTWKPTYITDSESGPASALVVNDGFEQIRPRRAAAEPDLHAAAVLTAMLQARGVVVGRAPTQGQAPAEASLLTSVSSPPIREVVGQMQRESDNLTAELLVKELGRRFGGAGSTAAGLGVVRQTLLDAGLPVDQLVAVDGSGLDRGDRVSCGLLVAALDEDAEGDLATGFPVAGRGGTLAKRFRDNPAAGRLRAKTGSLDGVAALTGFVDPLPPGGDPLLFAFVVNDLPRDAVGQALQEQIGAALASYPEAPAPEALAP